MTGTEGKNELISKAKCFLKAPNWQQMLRRNKTSLPLNRHESVIEIFNLMERLAGEGKVGSARTDFAKLYNLVYIRMVS